MKESFTNLADQLITGHELAKMLLQMPDYPVEVSGWGHKINNIEVSTLLASPNKLEELGRNISFTFDRIEDSEDEEEYFDGTEEFDFREFEERMAKREVILKKTSHVDSKGNQWWRATNNEKVYGEGRTKNAALAELARKLFFVKIKE